MKFNKTFQKSIRQLCERLELHECNQMNRYTLDHTRKQYKEQTDRNDSLIFEYADDYSYLL